jgi:hypothetical protein
VLDPGEAADLYERLLAALSEMDDPRLTLLAAEVTEAVAEGKPSSAEVNFRELRKREKVRRVEPFTPLEQLRTLVDAIEFALITPVDLADATLRTLNHSDDLPLAMEFQRDIAGAEGEASPRSDRFGRVAQEAVRWSRGDVADTQDRVAPLRLALASIREELES